MKGTHWQYGTGFQKILERRIVKRTLYFVMWQRWDPYSLKFCTTLSFQMIWCKFQSILVSHSSPIQYLNTVNPKALQQEREISSNQPKFLHECFYFLQQILVKIYYGKNIQSNFLHSQEIISRNEININSHRTPDRKRNAGPKITVKFEIIFLSKKNRVKKDF